MADRDSISKSCETVMNFNGSKNAADWTVCRQPATHYYPTAGGGTNALCDHHALKHPYAFKIERRAAPSSEDR